MGKVRQTMVFISMYHANVLSSYKACVRRRGVYSSASAGVRDINAQLVEPVFKCIANGMRTLVLLHDTC